jgi:Fe-S cluster assembly protein SufD
MSDGASIMTTPQLEVLSNEVMCKHGASIQTIDPEALLYLQNRGIDVPLAEKLMVEGFLRSRF